MSLIQITSFLLRRRNVKFNFFPLIHLEYDEQKHSRMFFCSKPATKNAAKKSQEVKILKEIHQYFEENKKLDIIKRFPTKLMRRKLRQADEIYISDPNVAKVIADYVTSDLPINRPILEVNPGIGLLSKELLKRNKVSKIYIYESENHFMPDLNEFHYQYPEKVKVKHGDILSMWKLNYRDKMDNGTRLDDLLRDIPRSPFNEEPNIRLVAGVGSYSFFKDLIHSMIFQGGIFAYGRAEMYLILPPPIYIHLTCNREAGYLLYRSMTILFQILFEYKLIDKLPKDCFLPWLSENRTSKKKIIKSVKSVNPEHFYLVKITPRKNIYELCPPEDMTALWFFIKQNCVSRANRVIPNLEKWIINCGLRLIFSPTEIERSRKVFPEEKIESLPSYCKPCMTLSNKDYYQNMTIFTQFGDLTPSQLLTLFCQFKSWPEYKESSFLASLEAFLLKTETSSDENVLNIPEEDDASHQSLLPSQPEDKSSIFAENISAKSEKKTKFGKSKK